MSALRSLILAAADSPRLQRFVQKYGFRLGAARFVAGETLDDAVAVLRRLNESGLLTNTTLLGEGVHDEGETRAVVAAYQEVLDRIHTEGLRTNLAVKLTHLGLSIDEDLAQSNLGELVEHAAGVGNFVRIDMEESRHVDAAYVRLLEASLAGDGFTAVATHDEQLIEHAIAFAQEREIPNDRFQFQMLYGVRPRLQLELVGRGFDVLVATPYGPEWYRYLMRRLAERPANLLFLLRNLVRG